MLDLQPLRAEGGQIMAVHRILALAQHLDHQVLTGSGRGVVKLRARRPGPHRPGQADTTPGQFRGQIGRRPCAG
jgi:hypothetical protein